MLTDEYGTASNIKSRVNRLSVLGAITSAQQRLKLYNKIPPNGKLRRLHHVRSIRPFGTKPDEPSSQCILYVFFVARQHRLVENEGEYGRVSQRQQGNVQQELRFSR